MTKINIGTNQGNITNVEIDKPFEDITYSDIRDIAIKKFPTGKLSIIGWAPNNKMTDNEIQEIIDSHSDYGMAVPYWINLPSSDVELSDEVKQQLSDYLNEYFQEHGPDANDDFTECSSCLMTRETAEKAVKYACEKTGLDDIPDYIIDGCSSIETDGRENDPVTHELLHGYPVHAPSIIEELEYIAEQEELSKDDWRFIDMAFDSYKCCNHLHNEEQSKDIRSLISFLVVKYRES